MWWVNKVNISVFKHVLKLNFVFLSMISLLCRIKQQLRILESLVKTWNRTQFNLIIVKQNLFTLIRKDKLVQAQFYY